MKRLILFLVPILVYATAQAGEYYKGFVLVRMKLVEQEDGSKIAVPDFPTQPLVYFSPHDVDLRAMEDAEGNMVLGVKIMVFGVIVAKADKQAWLTAHQAKDVFILGQTWQEAKQNFLQLVQRLDVVPAVNQKTGRLRWLKKAVISGDWKQAVVLKRFGSILGVSL